MEKATKKVMLGQDDLLANVPHTRPWKYAEVLRKNS